MKRRHFLSMLGAATVAPALPAFGAQGSVAAAAAGYNRYMYGLAVFHARTRASVSAVDLISRLKVSAVQANAMMGEMSASGVLSQATGAVRVATSVSPRQPYIRKALREIAEWVEDTDEIGDAALLRCTDGAQVVHTSRPPDTTTPDTISSGPKLGVH
jgi:hypothetical protein